MRHTPGMMRDFWETSTFFMSSGDEAAATIAGRELHNPGECSPSDGGSLEQDFHSEVINRCG